MKYIKTYESLIHKKSLDQLKKVMAMCKDTDIGLKTNSIDPLHSKSLLNTHIETWEEFVKTNNKENAISN